MKANSSCRQEGQAHSTCCQPQTSQQDLAGHHSCTNANPQDQMNTLTSSEVYFFVPEKPSLDKYLRKRPHPEATFAAAGSNKPLCKPDWHTILKQGIIVSEATTSLAWYLVLAVQLEVVLLGFYQTGAIFLQGGCLCRPGATLLWCTTWQSEKTFVYPFCTK